MGEEVIQELVRKDPMGTGGETLEGNYWFLALNLFFEISHFHITGAISQQLRIKKVHT